MHTYFTSADGTIDADYTWGQPPSTYVSSLDALRLLLLKARVVRTGPDEALRPPTNLFRPC
jgi:hypothetical protein